METADPDDVLTRCFLATYTGLVLRGVNINPGTDEQVGVIKHVLKYLGEFGVHVGARISLRSDRLCGRARLIKNRSPSTVAQF